MGTTPGPPIPPAPPADIEPALRDAGITIMGLDRQLRFAWIAASRRGLRTEEVRGHTVGEVAPADVARPLEEVFERARRTAATARAHAVVTLDGERLAYEWTVSPAAAVDGAPGGFVCFGVDVTRLHDAVTELEAVRERFQLALRNAPTVVWTQDLELRYTWASADAPGFTFEAARGRTDAELLPAAYAEPLEALKRRAIAGDEVVRAEVAWPVGDRETWWLLTVEPVHDAAGAVCAIACAATDISEGRAREREHARLSAIVGAIDDAVMRLAPAGEIESWNAGAERLFGFPAAEALGRPDPAFLLRDGTERETIEARLRRGGSVSGETQAVCRDGSVVDVWYTASPIRGPGGEFDGTAIIARDISRQVRAERALRYRAEHDELTGLVSRQRFHEELERELRYLSRYRVPCTLLLADVDALKGVNDTLGHHAGDALLRAAARVLRERVRETDVTARVGGDEFAVLLPHTRADEALIVATALVEGLREAAVVVDGAPVRSTLSVGLVELDEHVSAEEALMAADHAMYGAKHGGRDRVVAGALRDGEALASPERWSERLRAAIAEDRFVLHGQEVLDLGAGDLAEREVLLRLQEPAGGDLLPPGAFLAGAERHGLAGEIDRWVVRHAIALLAADPGGRTRLEVNLCGGALGDEALPGFIERELALRAIDPGRLSFEVGERAASANLGVMRAFVERLHAIGCEIGLDDYGSGVGSFTFLANVGVDYVKIDGALIERLGSDPNAGRVVRAINDVAHGLGIATIAEHVESADTLERLRAIGVDYAQGNHLGAPAPLAS